MKHVKIILALVLCLALLALIVQNTAPVETRFLWIKRELPAIVLLLATTVGGMLLGLFLALRLARSRKKHD